MSIEVHLSNRFIPYQCNFRDCFRMNWNDGLHVGSSSQQLIYHVYHVFINLCCVQLWSKLFISDSFQIHYNFCNGTRIIYSCNIIYILCTQSKNWYTIYISIYSYEFDLIFTQYFSIFVKIRINRIFRRIVFFKQIK